MKYITVRLNRYFFTTFSHKSLVANIQNFGCYLGQLSRDAVPIIERVNFIICGSDDVDWFASGGQETGGPISALWSRHTAVSVKQGIVSKFNFVQLRYYDTILLRTLIKKTIIFSSFIRKFRREQLQRHI